MTERKINVLVAEDSRVTQTLLVHLLESDSRIRVVGTVADGQAALDFVLRDKPDVVLMDIHMPRMDGFEATRRIMETRPVPIVICSATFTAQDLHVTFRAMEAGAIACVEKPVGREHPDFDTIAAHLLQTVRLMSEVKVIRRSARARPRPTPPAAHAPDQEHREQQVQAEHTPAIRIVGIGASTGGPPVLQTILCGLPKDFPAPILIVQHIAPGFVRGMAEWLNDTTGLHVHIAAHGILPAPGHVYIAPDDFHMCVGSGTIVLTREKPDNHLRPAVSVLFRSLAEIYGAGAVGVLLTGMGRDGAEQLKAMKDSGATTIAQDRETSVVHGMPGVAIELGAATHVLPAEKIADALIALVVDRNPERGIA